MHLLKIIWQLGLIFALRVACKLLEIDGVGFLLGACTGWKTEIGISRLTGSLLTNLLVLWWWRHFHHLRCWCYCLRGCSLLHGNRKLWTYTFWRGWFRFFGLSHSPWRRFLYDFSRLWLCKLLFRWCSTGVGLFSQQFLAFAACNLLMNWLWVHLQNSTNPEGCRSQCGLESIIISNWD